MPYELEAEWGLKPDRARDLEITHGLVTSRFAFPDGILFYPGSLTDIANPLFAAYYRVKYFVFVDVWGPSPEEIAKEFSSKFPESAHAQFAYRGHTELESWEVTNSVVNNMLYKTGISISAMIAIPHIFCRFRFDSQDRYLLYFKSGFERFLERNVCFKYDIVFDKDMWESPSRVSFDISLPKLRNRGLFISNSLGSEVIPMMPIFGLEYCGTIQMNGDALVCQKIQSKTRSELEEAEKLKLSFRNLVNRLMEEIDVDCFSELTKEDSVAKLALTLRKLEIYITGKVGFVPELQLFGICKGMTRKHTEYGDWSSFVTNDALYLEAWNKRNN